MARIRARVRRDRAADPPRLGAADRYPIRILTTGAGRLRRRRSSCALPFGLSVIEFTSQAPYLTSGLLQQVFVAAGGYPYLTVNAYNPWALVAGDTGHSLANAGPVGLRRTRATARTAAPGVAVFGPIPAVVIGTALLLAVIVVVAGRRRPPARPADDARRPDRPGARLLRGPDPGPRALRLPVLRAGASSSPRSRGAGGSPTSS